MQAARQQRLAPLLAQAMFVVGSAVWLWFVPRALGNLRRIAGAPAGETRPTGVILLTTVATQAVALPAFRRRNYNERLVIGSLAAGGTLDILIPPSISMIIYGVLAEESAALLEEFFREERRSPRR